MNNNKQTKTYGKKIVGRKVGMTRYITESGEALAVTVIECLPNYITQIKTLETDGYNSVQVTTDTKKANRVNKPSKGQFAKANVEAGRGLWEFRSNDETQSKVGETITLEDFASVLKVDVIGQSKGKGFSGVIKRYNFRMQDATHGNSLSHRAPGSIGQCQTPGRVFKGKKMAGHQGDERVTTLNLKVVKVNSDENYILVQGAVPGAKNGDVIIREAIKA